VVKFKVGDTLLDKRTLLEKFTQVKFYKAITRRMEMIGDRSGRIEVGKDLASKFKADLLTAGKIKYASSAVLSIVIYNIQKTLSDAFSEMKEEGEPDRVSKELSALFSLLDGSIVNATNAALDAKQVEISSLMIDLPDHSKARELLSEGTLPEDPARCKYPFYSHRCVDEPVQNMENLAENERLLLEWSEICAGFVEANKMGRQYSRSGEVISQKSPLPKQLSVHAQCPCYQQKCYGATLGAIEFPIGCRKDDG